MPVETVVQHRVGITDVFSEFITEPRLTLVGPIDSRLLQAIQQVIPQFTLLKAGLELKTFCSLCKDASCS